MESFKENGVLFEIVAETLGTVTGKAGYTVEPDKTYLNATPATYDALYVVGGQSNNQNQFDDTIEDFIRAHYKNLKPIGISAG